LSPSATQAPMNIIVKRTLKLPLLQWATYSRWSDPPPLFLFKNLLFLRTGPPHFWKGEKEDEKKAIFSSLQTRLWWWCELPRWSTRVVCSKFTTQLQHSHPCSLLTSLSLGIPSQTSPVPPSSRDLVLLHQ
jgi:hypothetical protein